MQAQATLGDFGSSDPAWLCCCCTCAGCLVVVQGTLSTAEMLVAGNVKSMRNDDCALKVDFPLLIKTVGFGAELW